MEIALYPPMLPSRPCRFCLTLQGGSAFADFDVDPDGRVFAVRVSFDGFGCCSTPAEIGRMPLEDSAALLAMVERETIDPTAESILRTYFGLIRESLWPDALARHDLLPELDEEDRAPMLRLLRSEGILCERFAFLARDELLLEGRELRIGTWAGSPVPEHSHGNVTAVGYDGDTVYWITVPQAAEGRTVRVLKPLLWVRRVSGDEWIALRAQQRPEQTAGLDDWFVSCGLPPAWINGGY